MGINFSDNRTYIDPATGEPETPSLGWRIWRVARVGVALLFAAAMLYLSGIHQFAMFQDTSQSSSAGQYEALIAEPRTDVPLDVFILASRSDVDNEEDIERLVNEASAILDQARIDLVIANIDTVTIEDESTANIVTSPNRVRQLLPPLNQGRLNLVLTETLSGLNGIAFVGDQVVAVAEYTTSFDFRVLAHEVGHALNLSHVSDPGNLMNSGGTGVSLTIEQARQAHSSALQFNPDS